MSGIMSTNMMYLCAYIAQGMGVHHVRVLGILKYINMKQTAVEWLMEQMLKPDMYKIWPHLLEIAKSMEKEQIMDAYCKGDDNIGAEQYYNETYNK